MSKRKYIVASIGKYHRPIWIFSHHTSARGADTKARKIAKKHKNLWIGVFGYSEDKFYGLLKTY